MQTDDPESNHSAEATAASASEVVKNNIGDFNKAVIANTFASVYDGLTFGQRRCLLPWAGGERLLGTSEYTGMVKKFHDHSPESTYEMAVRLSQPFWTQPALLYVDGAGGTYAKGGKPAAARYTGMNIKPFAQALFFEGIDYGSLDKQRALDGRSYEPRYLVPAIPTLFLFGHLSIGHGYQYRTLPGNLGDICDLATAYVKHQIATPMVPFSAREHARKLLPDTYIRNTITNTTELLAQYRRGVWNHPVNLEGDATLSSNSIVFHTTPYGVDFSKVDQVIEEILVEERKAKKSGYFSGVIASIVSPGPKKDERRGSGDADLPQGRTIIELKRSVDVFEVWEKVAPLVRFTTAVHPQPNYTDPDGYIVSPDPETALKLWYVKRVNLVMASKRKRLGAMQDRLNITAARLIIRDHVDEFIAIFKNAETPEDGIRTLMQRFELSRYQASRLSETPVSTLTGASREELARQLEKETADIMAFQRTLQQVPNEILDTIATIKRRYAVPRAVKTAAYIGYVAVEREAGPTGIVQFEETGEISSILANFPKQKVEVHLYDGKHLLWVHPTRRAVESIIPHYAIGDVYGLPFSGDAGYTVTIRDGAACSVAGIVPGPRKEGFYYVEKRAKGITRSGEIRDIDVTKDIKFLKSLGRGNNTDLIYIYPNLTKTHYVLMVNDTEPNVITLQRVDGGGAKIATSPIGNLELRHSATGVDWYFTIPDQYLNRVNVRVFHIVDAEELLGGKRYLRIDVGSTALKKNRLFRMLT